MCEILVQPTLHCPGLNLAVPTPCSSESCCCSGPSLKVFLFGTDCTYLILVILSQSSLRDTNTANAALKMCTMIKPLWLHYLHHFNWHIKEPKTHACTYPTTNTIQNTVSGWKHSSPWSSMIPTSALLPYSVYLQSKHHSTVRTAGQFFHRHEAKLSWLSHPAVYLDVGHDLACLVVQ